MGLVHFVLGAMWFLLPAGAASTAPVLVRRVPLLNVPVDFGTTWRGEPLFGRNKTWRGLIAASLVGLLVFWLQQIAVDGNRALHSLVLFGPIPAPIAWGAVIGAGAILGDLAKSFCKRRARIEPGRSWFPFDQIDYSVGALAALAPWAFPGWRRAAGIVAVGLVLHLASVAVGRAIGVRERWI